MFLHKEVAKERQVTDEHQDNSNAEIVVGIAGLVVVHSYQCDGVDVEANHKLNHLDGGDLLSDNVWNLHPVTKQNCFVHCSMDKL